MASEFLYNVIQSHIDSFEKNLFSCLPARVIGYDSEKQNVDVELLLKKTYSDGVQQKELTRLYKVPVCFPSAGGGILSFPIQNNDLVLLVFSDMSTDEWRLGDGAPLAPKDNRRHSMNDAFAIPGIGLQQNNLTPNPDDVEIKFNGNSYTLEKDGTISQVTASKYSVDNGTEELIQVLSDALQIVSDITTNTVYSGFTPINNKADVLAVKARLDTFKR